MRTTNAQQLTLFQARVQMEQYIEYTTLEQTNALAEALNRRQLPQFYFTEAGGELGVSAKTCREWRINAWPITHRAQDQNLMYKLGIYLRVYLRLSNYPANETYAQAMEILQQRIKQLEEQRFSRNQISQQMRLSFRTLKQLREREGQ